MNDRDDPLWYCEACLATDHVPAPGTCRVCGSQMVLAAGYALRRGAAKVTAGHTDYEVDDD